MGKYVTIADVQTYAPGLERLPSNINALIAQAEAIAESPVGFGRSLIRPSTSPEPFQERIIQAVYVEPGLCEAFLPDAKPEEVPFQWVELAGRPVGGGYLPQSIGLPPWVTIDIGSIEIDRNRGRLLVPVSPWYGRWVEFRARFRVGWINQSDVPQNLRAAISLLVEWLARGGMRLVRSVSQTGISFDQTGALSLPETVTGVLSHFKLIV
ncbi:MAG: hypothetical protein V2G41_09290 [bacterium JZ-2024 1]